MGKKVQKPEVKSDMQAAAANCNALPHFYRFLTALICCHFLLITSLSFLRFLTYKADFDVTEFNTAFWSLLHTGVPMIFYSPADAVNWFGAVHFSPVFYLLVPLYALWPSPFMLQIIHCACLSGAAAPVALALRRLELGDKTILALIAMLLFNPFYFDTGLWEFHEVSIGCLLIACAYWALLARHRTGFLLSLFLLLFTKEHFGLTVAGFGALWWWRHRDGWFGFWVALAGLAAFYLVLEIIMPGLNNGLGHFMLQDGEMTRYAWLKGNAENVLYNGIYLFFINDPHTIRGIGYLAVLFFTNGFLALLSPLYLLPGLSDLATILLSAHYFPRSLSAYHSSSLVPALIIATGMTIAHYKKKLPEKLPLWVVLLAFTVGINIALFSKNSITAYELSNPSPVINFQVADKIKSIIGKASVSAQSNIAFLFSSGPATVYPFPANRETSEFVALYLRHPYKHPYYFVWGDIYKLQPQQHYDAVLNLLENAPEWGIVLWDDNWLLLKKDTPDQLPVRQDIIRQLYSIPDRAQSAPLPTWTPF